MLWLTYDISWVTSHRISETSDTGTFRFRDTLLFAKQKHSRSLALKCNICFEHTEIGEIERMNEQNILAGMGHFKLVEIIPADFREKHLVYMNHFFVFIIYSCLIDDVFLYMLLKTELLIVP